MLKYALVLAIFTLKSIYAAAPTVIDGGYIRGQANNAQNFAPNPFAEKNLTGWTGTNITATRITSAGNQLNGISSFNLSSATNGGTFVSSAMTLFDGQLGSCEAQVYFKASSGSSANYTFYLDNGSGSVLNSVVLSNVSTWTKASFNYPCGSGYKLGISHQGTSTDVIQVGNFYWGAATNIGSVAQAQLIGGVVITGCSTDFNTTSTTFVIPSNPTGCVYTTFGQALAPTTANTPALKFASLPAGDYKLEYEGQWGNNTAGKTTYAQFTDGTTTARESSQIYNSAGVSYLSGLSQSITYSTAQSNVNLSIQLKADTGSGARLWGMTAGSGPVGVIRVYRFPSQSEIAVRPDQTVVRVEASRNATQAVNANVDNVLFQVETIDTHSAFTSGVFTAPIAGDYIFSAGFADNASSTHYAAAYINGAFYKYGSVGAQGGYSFVGGIARLAKGDTLSFRDNTTLTTSAGGWLSIQNISQSLPAPILMGALPTITKLTSGSGTYTTPAAAKYIKVRMVGGGGGGGGGGTSAGVGGTGGVTTFGTSLLTANGGTCSSIQNASAGGTATVSGVSYYTAIQGGYGTAGAYNGTSAWASGGSGGVSLFGGAGGGQANSSGIAAIANTGSGGGGGGGNNANIVIGGSGGGAGGYVEAIITNPLSSYAYAVGSAGTAGTAGTNGYAGGAGGSGVIIIEEYYY